MTTTAEGPRVPVTGPRATTHEGARQLTRAAQDALDARDAGKRAAALKDPGSVGDEYRQKARGQRWIGPHAFDKAGSPRTNQ